MPVLCELLISAVSHPTFQGLREELSGAQMLGVTLLQEDKLLATREQLERQIAKVNISFSSLLRTRLVQQHSG